MIYDIFLTVDTETSSGSHLGTIISIQYDGTDFDTEAEVLSHSETILDAYVTAGKWYSDSETVTSYTLKTYKVTEIHQDPVLLEGTFT